MTVESALQTLHWLREIFEEAKAAVQRLSGGKRGVPRSLVKTMTKKEYNSLVQEYEETVAAMNKTRDAYLAIRAFYAFPDTMDKEMD